MVNAGKVAESFLPFLILCLTGIGFEILCSLAYIMVPTIGLKTEFVVMGKIRELSRLG